MTNQSFAEELFTLDPNKPLFVEMGGKLFKLGPPREHPVEFAIMVLIEETTFEDEEDE